MRQARVRVQMRWLEVGEQEGVRDNGRLYERWKPLMVPYRDLFRVKHVLRRAPLALPPLCSLI